MIPPIMSAEEFESSIEINSSNVSLVLAIFRTHDIIVTARMYEIGKLEQAIEDARLTRGWDLNKIIVVNNITLSKDVLDKSNLNHSIRACLIIYDISFEDLIMTVKKSLKMKAFL